MNFIVALILFYLKEGVLGMRNLRNQSVQDVLEDFEDKQ